VFGVALMAGVPASATVTVTDCGTDPHVTVVAGTTRLDTGGDDLVLRCNLTPRPGTTRVAISAADVSIERPGGGASAGGASKAVAITASGDVKVNNATLAATNGNGSLEILAVGTIDLQSATITVGSPNSGGDSLKLTCTGTQPACQISSLNSNLKSRQ